MRESKEGMREIKWDKVKETKASYAIKTDSSIMKNNVGSALVVNKDHTRVTEQEI